MQVSFHTHDLVLSQPPGRVELWHCCYLHFADEEIESQESCITCPNKLSLELNTEILTLSTVLFYHWFSGGSLSSSLVCSETPVLVLFHSRTCIVTLVHLIIVLMCQFYLSGFIPIGHGTDDKGAPIVAWSE